MIDLTKQRFKEIDDAVVLFLNERPDNIRITEQKFWKLVRTNKNHRDYATQVIKSIYKEEISVVELVTYVTLKEQEVEQAKEADLQIQMALAARPKY